MPRFLNSFALLALAAGCETTVNKSLPPLDSGSAAFQFPTGLAVRKLPLPSGHTALLVISSNFDLRYDRATGGTLLSVDLESSPNSLPLCDSAKPLVTTCCDPAQETCGSTLAVLGAARMGSFGGEVTYADPALVQDPLNLDPHACPQLGSLRSGALTRVVAVSRSENSAYWMTMDGTGHLACDESPGACTIPLVNPNTKQQNTGLGDAFGVTIACSDLGGTPATVNGQTTLQASAFITHLSATNDEGWMTEVPLVSSRDCSSDTNNACDANTPPVVPAGSSPGDLLFQDLGATGDSYSNAYDASTGRLYVTSRVGPVGSTPLRWLDYATPMLLPASTLPQVPTRSVGQYNLYPALHGSLTRSLVLSHDGSRGYMAVQIYDTVQAASTGDYIVLATLLVVLDLSPGPTGAPSFAVLNTVPIPSGPSQVKVLPRRGSKRDLVAVTCTDDGYLVLYDDETGDLVATIGLDRESDDPKVLGNPILGKQLFGLAVEAKARTSGCKLGGTSCDWLYVGSFDRGWVNVVEVNPDDPSAGWNTPAVANGPICTSQSSCPALVKRIGRERP
jgi:hypothetical protein